MSSVEPAGAPPTPETPVHCPLCDTPVGTEGARCPSCGLYLGPESGRPSPFTQRVLWLLVAGVVAVYLIPFGAVALIA